MNKSVRLFLISAAIFLISIAIFSGNIEKTPFHGDESGWISTGYYYTDLLLRRDFSPDKWEGRPCGFFGASCCVLVFFIGYFAGNFWVGLIGAALIMTNSVFITFSTRAVTDIYYNFFLLCSYLCVIFFVKAAQKRHLILSSLLCGIFAGLATSVKITGIGVVGPIFLSV